MDEKQRAVLRWTRAEPSSAVGEQGPGVKGSHDVIEVSPNNLLGRIGEVAGVEAAS